MLYVGQKCPDYWVYQNEVDGNFVCANKYNIPINKNLILLIKNYLNNTTQKVLRCDILNMIRSYNFKYTNN